MARKEGNQTAPELLRNVRINPNQENSEMNAKRIQGSTPEVRTHPQAFPHLKGTWLIVLDPCAPPRRPRVRIELQDYSDQRAWFIIDDLAAFVQGVLQVEALQEGRINLDDPRSLPAAEFWVAPKGAGANQHLRLAWGRPSLSFGSGREIGLEVENPSGPEAAYARFDRDQFIQAVRVLDEDFLEFLDASTQALVLTAGEEEVSVTRVLEIARRLSFGAICAHHYYLTDVDPLTLAEDTLTKIREELG